MDSINEETINTTSFMGVTLSKDGQTDFRITKALNSSGTLS